MFVDLTSFKLLNLCDQSLYPGALLSNGEQNKVGMHHCMCTDSCNRCEGHTTVGILIDMQGDEPRLNFDQ